MIMLCAFQKLEERPEGFLIAFSSKYFSMACCILCTVPAADISKGISHIHSTTCGEILSRTGIECVIQPHSVSEPQDRENCPGVKADTEQLTF